MTYRIAQDPEIATLQDWLRIHGTARQRNHVARSRADLSTPLFRLIRETVMPDGYAEQVQGGFVESLANIRSPDEEAWVGGNAVVFGYARICDYASVTGTAIVCSRVRVSDSATVGGNATVGGRVWVRNHAQVQGEAIVLGIGSLSGQASVGGHALFRGSVVDGTATVGDFAQLGTDVRVLGRAAVRGYTRLCGDVTLTGSVIVDWHEPGRTLNVARHRHEVGQAHLPGPVLSLGEYRSHAELATALGITAPERTRGPAFVEADFAELEMRVAASLLNPDGSVRLVPGQVTETGRFSSSEPPVAPPPRRDDALPLPGGRNFTPEMTLGLACMAACESLPESYSFTASITDPSGGSQDVYVRIQGHAITMPRAQIGSQHWGLVTFITFFEELRERVPAQYDRVANIIRAALGLVAAEWVEAPKPVVPVQHRRLTLRPKEETNGP